MQAEVKEYMSGSPISIEADASALEALDLLVEHGIRHLPVVDGGGRVRGVLSIDDLRAAFPMEVSLRRPPSAEERPALAELQVGEVMTYAPMTVQVSTPLERAALLMAEHRIGCLPVVDDEGRLDGILSETDLLHALATALWTERVGATPSPDRGLSAVLEAERRHLAEQLAAYERHEQELTRTTREVPSDEADAGNSREEALLTEQLAELASRRLRAVEHALERASRGELTRCEACGGAIPEARLRALPEATLCIRCAREREAGRR